MCSGSILLKDLQICFHILFSISETVFKILKKELSLKKVCHGLGVQKRLDLGQNTFKDNPAQWAKIRRGLDIFRISSKCVSIEWQSLGKFDRSVFTQLNFKVGKKCMGSYGSSEKWR